ncbi:O-acetyl-ADP-ribose deacetylase, partial [Mesorhizobium sp. M8A.F.Ca.ET.142.01.1.1]
AWQRSHAQPMRIVLVAFNTATAKAYQQALNAAGQGADSEPRGSMLPPLGDAGFAAAH